MKRSPLRRVFAWPVAALRAAMLAVLWFYRHGISPYLPPACRFEPTCSAYAEKAVHVHGPFKGFWLSVRRVGRCHPWSEGGYDPVPPPDEGKG